MRRSVVVVMPEGIRSVPAMEPGSDRIPIRRVRLEVLAAAGAWAWGAGAVPPDGATGAGWAHPTSSTTQINVHNRSFLIGMALASLSTLWWVAGYCAMLSRSIKRHSHPVRRDDERLHPRLD